MLDRSDSAAVEWERVGSQLQAARERKGMPLCELSRRTRIKVPLLEALEQGEVEKLPRGPFRRGFARAYALEVGLDAERLLAHFPSEATPLSAPVAASTAEPQLTSGAFAGRLLVSAAMVAVAIIVPRWMLGSGEDAPVAQAAAIDAVGTAGVQLRDVSAPAATSVRTEPQAAATDPRAPITVVLRAVDNVWIQADSDGERVAYDLLPSGTVRTFTARRSLALRIGDAGAIEYTINGVPGAVLGPRGAVRDLNLSPPPPQ